MYRLPLELRKKLAIIFSSVGAILFIFGFLLYRSASSSKYYKVESFDYAYQTADVKNIEISASNGDILVKNGDFLTVTANDVVKGRFSSKLEGNTLTINYNLGFVDGNIGKYTGKPDSKITITLPSKLYEQISIINGDGSFSLRNLTCNSANIVTGDGDSEFYDFSVNQKCEIKRGFGKLSFVNSCFDNTIISNGVGELLFRKCSLTNLRYSTTWGKLRMLLCTLKGENSIETGFGKSSISLIGNTDNYGFEFTKGHGSITVNDKDCSAFDKSGKEVFTRFVGGFGDSKITIS